MSPLNIDFEAVNCQLFNGIIEMFFVCHLACPATTWQQWSSYSMNSIKLNVLNIKHLHRNEKEIWLLCEYHCNYGHVWYFKKETPTSNCGSLSVQSQTIPYNVLRMCIDFKLIVLTCTMNKLKAVQKWWLF